jgi:ABC-type glutathione transport system ATPase component
VVDGLKKYYPVRGGILGGKIGEIRAVDGVSFTLRRGETLGLVGESGCGKSTLGRALNRLEEPTDGTVLFEGKDLAHASRAELFRLRRDIQMIFQDPYSSLNPRMTVGEIVREPLLVHGVGTKAEQVEKVRELFEIVGLPGDTSSPAASGSGSELRGRSCSNPSSSSRTSPSRRWMFRYRARC